MILEETVFIECVVCGDEHTEEKIYTLVNGEPVCEACVDNGEVQYCEECTDLHYPNNLTNVDGLLLCNRCVFNHTDICINCDERRFNDVLVYDSRGDVLCEDCYYDYYATCVSCGEFVHNSEVEYRYDDAYCPNCTPTIGILPYNTKPKPIFFGESPDHEFFGIELEIDAHEWMDNEETAEHIQFILDGEVYCKEDGSLDEGFEIVTHPCTFDHLMNMPWERIFSDLVEDGYRSHDIGTCGLHIHISKKAFGENPDTQEANIAKLLFIVERHWEKMVKFSRRTEAQLDRWADRYLKGCRTDNLNMLDLFDIASNSGRYHAVNLENRHTVELRLFRGTLRYNTFIATIQFVKILRNLIIEYSINDLQVMTWNDIAIYLQKSGYEELNTYLKERGLDTNISAISNTEEIA